MLREILKKFSPKEKPRPFKVLVYSAHKGEYKINCHWVKRLIDYCELIPRTGAIEVFDYSEGANGERVSFTTYANGTLLNVFPDEE